VALAVFRQILTWQIGLFCVQFYAKYLVRNRFGKNQNCAAKMLCTLADGLNPIVSSLNSHCQCFPVTADTIILCPDVSGKSSPISQTATWCCQPTVTSTKCPRKTWHPSTKHHSAVVNSKRTRRATLHFVYFHFTRAGVDK